MNTKVLLHCGGGSNLILGTSRGKKIFLTTPAAINFFHQVLKNFHSYGQYFQKKIIRMDSYQCLDVFYSDR